MEGQLLLPGFLPYNRFSTAKVSFNFLKPYIMLSISAGKNTIKNDTT